tara:strand:- start:87 stop:599 length:513 start_codon:yes stop_codon:yes gene_type:complete
MNITKILSWMENYDSLVELPKLQKILFMMTNITYFIPIVFFGINIISIIIAIMGTVSTSFHGCQCCLKCPHKVTRTLLWCDILFVIPASFIIIYLCYHLLPASWYIVWIFVVPIFMIAVPSLGKTMYAILHGIWHVLSAGLFVYAAKVYSDDKKEDKKIKGILKPSSFYN